MSLKSIVVGHLLDLGLKAHEDELQVTHGGIHKTHNEILESWQIRANTPDKSDGDSLIVSEYTLTKCRGGIYLVENSDDSDVYGDFIAKPKPKRNDRDYWALHEYGLENGSFYRVSRYGVSQFINGDYMGMVWRLPRLYCGQPLKFFSRWAAEELIPKVCR